MKTKVLFFALAASLLVFSGCSKKDKNSFSWTTQLKTCESYLGQDSAAVAQQLLNDGYTYAKTISGTAYFGKLWEEYGYTFGIACSANSKVNQLEFSVDGAVVPEEVTKTDVFVDLVKAIGAQYTSARGTVYNFNKCSYENASGSFAETDYTKLESMLEQVINYNPRIIWNGASDSEIEIDRYNDYPFIMTVAISDYTIK